MKSKFNEGYQIEIESGQKENFGYILYHIDKYSNEFKFEYKVISSNDGKQFYGFTAEEVMAQFNQHVEIQMNFIMMRLEPLTDNEIQLLKDKISKNIRYLYKKLIKDHYLNGGDYGLTSREIFNEKEYISKLLHDTYNDIEITYKQIDRYIGGYYYILLNKKYENDIEIFRIQKELNERY